MFEVTLNCSECGKEFTLLNTKGYSYRVEVTPRIKSKLPEDSIYGSKSYQCSYTCNDHALLRVSRSGHMTKENIIKYITRSEETIRAKGKVVRYPINIDDIKVKE